MECSGCETKVLVIGDPHFSTKNARESEELVKQTLTLLNNTEIDFVVLLGDLLNDHSRAHVLPYNRMIGFIDSIRKLRPLYILIGNHDKPNNNDFLTTNHFFTGLKGWNNVTIVDHVFTREEGDGKKFVFCPYVPNGRFLEALGEIDMTTVSTVFAHQEFKGCKMGAIESVHGDVWPLEYPLVVSGHIHEKQQPQPNVFYPGTPLQHGYGDSDDKYICVLQVGTPNGSLVPSIRFEFVQVEFVKKVVINITTEELDEFVPPMDRMVKLKISGTKEKLRAIARGKRIRELREQGVEVVMKTEREVGNALNALGTEPKDLSFLQAYYSVISADARKLEWFEKLVGKA